jgi:hypothetical protein
MLRAQEMLQHSFEWDRVAAASSVCFLPSSLTFSETPSLARYIRGESAVGPWPRRTVVRRLPFFDTHVYIPRHAAPCPGV